MSNRGHAAFSDRHELFADIVKSVASDESIVARSQPVYPAPSPFEQKVWTDAGGIEWKIRRARRGRLVTLINDAHVPVREFDRWTAEVRTLSAEEAQGVIADLMAERHEIADFCEGMDVAEARNEDRGSEVWVGRIWANPRGA
jgi:hypothetical protein